MTVLEVGEQGGHDVEDLEIAERQRRADPHLEARVVEQFLQAFRGSSPIGAGGSVAQRVGRSGPHIGRAEVAQGRLEGHLPGRGEVHGGAGT
jgi:hypothetical protein